MVKKIGLVATGTTHIFHLSLRKNFSFVERTGITPIYILHFSMLIMPEMALNSTNCELALVLSCIHYSCCNQ